MLQHQVRPQLLARSSLSVLGLRPCSPKGLLQHAERCLSVPGDQGQLRHDPGHHNEVLLYNI